MNNVVYVMDQLKQRLGDDVTITEKKIVKNNGIVLDSFVISTEGKSVSPVVYYDADKDDDEIIEDVIEAYSKARSVVDMDGVASKDYVLDHVFMTLVNSSTNDLSDMAHREFLDLSIVYRCSTPDGEGSFGLKNGFVEDLGIAEEELYESALEHTNGGMYNFMMMRVVSNDSRHYGAAVIANEKKLHEILGDDDYYVLPSSIHEFIVIPCCECNMPIEYMSGMVKAINETEVRPDEVLSNSVYMYRNCKMEVVG